MRNKTMKKGLVIGMSAVLLASSLVPANVQAAAWKQNKTGWWWQEDNGSYPVSTWKSIRGNWYYFDQNGYMKTGWLKEKENWYYLGSANDGAMKTGWQKVNENWYYLDASGVMKTGWQGTNTGWYYLDPSGAMHTGWLKDNDAWYYLGGVNDGAMKVGWQQVGGTWYYLNADGKMAADTWIGNRYVDESGAWTKTRQPAQWIQSGKRWWYRHEDGSYTSNGFEKIGGKTYYFDAEGWMIIGWKQLGEDWYYFDASGAMVTGAWVGNYYLDEDGVMATDTWIGNYYVDASGKWVPNKVKEEGELESIQLDQKNAALWIGEDMTLTVIYNPADTTTDKSVTWSSSDENVATVVDGKVTGVGKGTATITAKVAGRKATCKVEVTPELRIVCSDYEERGYLPFGTDEIGENGAVMFFPENGEFIDELVGTEWSIADESIAEITEVILDGKAVNVRGLKEGTTTLTATFKGKSTSMEITTKKVAKLESLSFPQETYTKKVGEKFILLPDPYPTNAYLRSYGYYFTSSDPEVAWVEGGSGVVRTKKEGTTVITFNYGGGTGAVGINASYTLKVEGSSDDTVPELIRYEPENDHGIPVGERVKPNIVVYPVTCQYMAKDIKLTVIEREGPKEGSAKIEDGEIIGTSQGWVTIEASLEGCEPIQFWLYFNDGSYN